MDIDSWLQLVAVCFLGAISPGPSLALVVNNTIVRGRSFGVATGIGHGTGIGIWALLTAAGIAKIIFYKSSILLALQSLGACLVGFIGFRTITNRDLRLVQQKVDPISDSKTLFRGYSEGFLISLFNPKIALFFLAIFSHFVQSGSNNYEVVLMGSTAALVDAIWYASVAFMLTGSDMGRILEKRADFIRLVSGGFLILVAIYLLTGAIQRLL